jgi:hypothetical protein
MGRDHLGIRSAEDNGSLHILSFQFPSVSLEVIKDIRVILVLVEGALQLYGWSAGGSPCSARSRVSILVLVEGALQLQEVSL